MQEYVSNYVNNNLIKLNKALFSKNINIKCNKLNLIIDFDRKNLNDSNGILNDISTLISRLKVIDKGNKNIISSSGLLGNKMSNLIDQFK
jgi:hypothetical protein